MTPGMSKTDAQTELVPRLRFPEFRDTPAWTESALTDICEVNPAHDGLPESFYYIDLESVEAGTLRTPKRVERAHAPSRAQRHLRDGDILYQTVRPYQRNNLLFDFSGKDDYVASTGYAQLRARESIGFLYQLIHTDLFVQRVLAKCTGSNYPAIKSSDLESVSIWIPPDPAEQRKIAACLGSLDDLIAAEGRKLAALRDHRKGLMQQLFPHQGETRPHLRFPEFRQAPEWATHKLGDAAEFFNGRAYKKEELLNEGKYRVLRVGNFFSNAEWYFSNLELEDSKYASTGDLLYAWSASFGPRIWQGEKVIYHYHIWKVVPKNGIRRDFLYFTLDRETERLKAESTNGLGMLHITKGTIESWECVIPRPDEQKRIADCLSTIDAMIAAQVEKLDALRTHKRGLMQQLFSSPEDAEA